MGKWTAGGEDEGEFSFDFDIGFSLEVFCFLNFEHIGGAGTAMRGEISLRRGVFFFDFFWSSLSYL